MKTKENAGTSSSNPPPPEPETSSSSNEDETEDQQQVIEGDEPAAETPHMIAIRANEKRKKRSQEVTPCNDPTPQPRHTKPLGANTRYASGAVTGGGSEGGRNGVGAGTAVGSEGGVSTGGGSEGGVVVTGGTEVYSCHRWRK